MTEKSPQRKFILHSNIGLRVKLSQRVFLFTSYSSGVGKIRFIFFFELSLSRAYIMYRKL